MHFRLSVYVSVWLVFPVIGGPWPLAAEIPPEKTEVAVATQSSRFVEWESLGFSSDGRYFADMVYGVEYGRSQGDYFARLRILHLAGDSGELVWEQSLRRSRSLLPLPNQLFSEHYNFMVRAIAQELLRRESRMLNKFQIEAMELGEILPVKEPVPEQAKVETPEPVAAGMVVDVEPDMTVSAEAAAPKTYTAMRISNGTPLAVFSLQNLRLDQDFGAGGILRGSLNAREWQGAPRSYEIEQEWPALRKYGRQPDIEPVFISLSPNARHLVLTLRMYRKPDLADSNFEEPNEPMPDEQARITENPTPVISASRFETNNNYDFVSLILRTY